MSESFNFSFTVKCNHHRIDQKAMETRFSTFSWQPSGVFSTPTGVFSTPTAFLQARARRGRGSTLQGALLRPTLRERLTSEREEEEKEDAEEEARKSGGSLADLHL